LAEWRRRSNKAASSASETGTISVCLRERSSIDQARTFRARRFGKGRLSPKTLCKPHSPRSERGGEFFRKLADDHKVSLALGEEPTQPGSGLSRPAMHSADRQLATSVNTRDKNPKSIGPIGIRYSSPGLAGLKQSLTRGCHIAVFGLDEPWRPARLDNRPLKPGEY
jgi:hypothetical protein